jgi:hypothetical protein
MGITPGWGDVYWLGVQEQFLEVKDLAPGDYWLEMEIDPLKRLKVKSRNNHKERVKVTLVINPAGRDRDRPVRLWRWVRAAGHKVPVFADPSLAREQRRWACCGHLPRNEPRS